MSQIFYYSDIKKKKQTAEPINHDLYCRVHTNIPLKKAKSLLQAFWNKNWKKTIWWMESPYH